MDQRPSFTIPGNSRLVCRLRRTLYGLKQSPRAWFGHFSSALIQFGMTRCEVDRSIFLLSMLMTLLLLEMTQMVSSDLKPTFSRNFRQKTWSTQILLRH
jgi:hypothetical protein